VRYTRPPVILQRASKRPSAVWRRLTKKGTIEVELSMPKNTVVIAVAVALLGASLAAQEQEKKKVPKDSVRVAVPGCVKGYIFTAAPRTEDQPGSGEIPPGMHLRMNGPKKMMEEIKAHEGQMIEITGLMKKGQYTPGVGIGGGVRVMPGQSPASGGGMGPAPTTPQNFIDVEGWRLATGNCPS